MQGPLVWLVFARAPSVGRIRLAELMQNFPDPVDAWQLGVNDLVSLEGWSRSVAESLVRTRQDRQVHEEAAAEWQRAQAAGLKLVALPDPDYPVRLRQIADPPPYFYQAGPWTPDARPVVAVIGTRKPTAYGLSVAERFGYDLAAAGAVVVSGMARGVDCAAHRGALRAGGTTVAVLGGGADVCYPREAASLYRQIRATGAVISEQPPGAEPRREFFPERNRIISGLGHGVVVVEAGERSGTLITVSAALRQGREVFAVPGPITSPLSTGPHLLLRDGAGIATAAADVLADLGFSPGAATPRSAPVHGLSTTEEQLLTWMGLEPRWATDLVAVSGWSTGEVQGALTFLELKGLIRQLPTGQYARIS